MATPQAQGCPPITEDKPGGPPTIFGPTPSCTSFIHPRYTWARSGRAAAVVFIQHTFTEQFEWALGCRAEPAVLLTFPLPDPFPSLLQSVWTPHLGSLALSNLRVTQGQQKEQVWVLRPPRPPCCGTKVWAVAGSLCAPQDGPSAQPQPSPRSSSPKCRPGWVQKATAAHALLLCHREWSLSLRRC